MKKILCLAISLAMVLSLMFIPASAASVDVTLTVTGDTGKTGDIIEMTYSVKGVESVFSWQGIIEYNHAAIVPAQSSGAPISYKSATPTEATTANAKKALVSSVLDDMFGADEYAGDYEESPIWGQTGVSTSWDDATKVGKFTIYASTAGSEAEDLPAIVSADGYDMFTLRFVRVADDTPINVKFAEGGECPIVETTSLSGNIVTSTKIDYTAPGGSTGGNDTFDATVEDVPTWNAKFDYVDETGATQENATYTGKKVVTFGKNASGATLNSGEYGVQIGNRTYAGRMDVPAGAYFAIIVVNSVSDAAILDSYEYKVWTGSEDAPQYETEALNALVD